MIQWFSIIIAHQLQQILASRPQHGAHTWQYFSLRKNVFWYVMPYSLPAHHHFGRTYRLHSVCLNWHLKFPTFYRTWRIIKTFTIVCHLSLSWYGWIQSYFFTIHFSSPHLCNMSRLSHSPSFDHPNNVWWQAQIIYASIFTIILSLFSLKHKNLPWYYLARWSNGIWINTYLHHKPHSQQIKSNKMLLRLQNPLQNRQKART